MSRDASCLSYWLGGAEETSLGAVLVFDMVKVKLSSADLSG